MYAKAGRSARPRHATARSFTPSTILFLSSAHRPADIDEALQAASRGFKVVRELEARSNR